MEVLRQLNFDLQDKIVGIYEVKSIKEEKERLIKEIVRLVKHLFPYQRIYYEPYDYYYQFDEENTIEVIKRDICKTTYGFDENGKEVILKTIKESLENEIKMLKYFLEQLFVNNNDFVDYHQKNINLCCGDYLQLNLNDWCSYYGLEPEEGE